eukprot:680329-Rhodomonas_salina.3
MQHLSFVLRQDRLNKSEKELLVLRCKVKAVEFEKEQHRQKVIRAETDIYDLTEEIRTLQLLDQERADEQLLTMVPRIELVAAQKELEELKLFSAEHNYKTLPGWEPSEMEDLHPELDNTSKRVKKHTGESAGGTVTRASIPMNGGSDGAPSGFVSQEEVLERESAFKKQLDEVSTARAKEAEESAAQLRGAEEALAVLLRLEDECKRLSTEVTEYQVDSAQAKSNAEREIAALKEELSTARLEVERRDGLEVQLEGLKKEAERWKQVEAERELAWKKEQEKVQEQFDQQLSTMVHRSKLVAAQRELEQTKARAEREIAALKEGVSIPRSELDAAQRELEECKRELEESKRLLSAVEQAESGAAREIAALKEELSTESKQRDGMEKELGRLQEEVERVTRESVAGAGQGLRGVGEDELSVEEVRRRAEELEREQHALEEEVKGLETALRASKAAEKKHRVDAQAAAERVEEMGREVARIRAEVEVERKRRKEEEEENERIVVEVKEKTEEVERMERRCEDLERRALARESEGQGKSTPATVKRSDDAAG